MPTISELFGRDAGKTLSDWITHIPGEFISGTKDNPNWGKLEHEGRPYNRISRLRSQHPGGEFDLAEVLASLHITPEEIKARLAALSGRPVVFELEADDKSKRYVAIALNRGSKNLEIAVETESMLERHNPTLTELDPVLKHSAARIFTQLIAMGWVPHMPDKSGARAPKTEAELVAEKKSQRENSLHVGKTSHALDIVMEQVFDTYIRIKNADVKWREFIEGSKPTFPISADEQKFFESLLDLKELAESENLVWGGDWKTLFDPAHLELKGVGNVAVPATAAHLDHKLTQAVAVHGADAKSRSGWAPGIWRDFLDSEFDSTVSMPPVSASNSHALGATGAKKARKKPNKTPNSPGLQIQGSAMATPSMESLPLSGQLPSDQSLNSHPSTPPFLPANDDYLATAAIFTPLEG